MSWINSRTEREGNEQLFAGGRLREMFPDPDVLTVEGLESPVAPLCPAAVCSHRDGDATGSGGVYCGKLLPQLVGNYIFSDMTTGRLFYADLQEMIATQGRRNKQAPIHGLQVMYKSPYAGYGQGTVNRRTYDIVADEYAHKEGNPNRSRLVQAPRKVFCLDLQ